jgi:hypothetical protein
MDQLTLENFAKNNPHANVRSEGDSVTIDAPWGSKNVAIVSEKTDHEFLQELESVWLNPAFDAVIHLDTDLIEVLFLYLDPGDKIQSSHMNRSFTVYYEGTKFTPVHLQSHQLGSWQSPGGPKTFLQMTPAEVFLRLLHLGMLSGWMNCQIERKATLPTKSHEIFTSSPMHALDQLI